MIVLCGSIVLVLSAYFPPLQPCVAIGMVRRCSPLELSAIAPILILGFLLMFPNWTDISIGGLAIRRELRETRQEQEVLRQLVELRSAIEQVSKEPAPEAVDAVSANVGEKIDEIKKVLQRVRSASPATHRPMSLSRRLESLERVVDLAALHPQAVNAVELDEVLQRAVNLEKLAGR